MARSVNEKRGGWRRGGEGCIAFLLHSAVSRANNAIGFASASSSRNPITMTRAECDSTTEILFQDGPIHARGCTGTSAHCTSSILRLALLAGSAYAVRFTSCIIDVNSSRRPKERKKHCPYQKRKTLGYRPISRIAQEVAVDIVSSNTDINLIEDAKIESNSKVCIDLKAGSAESFELTGVPEPFDEVQNFSNPLRTREPGRNL